MTSDSFKREVHYVVSLGLYERGCELCNYLLNLKSSPNYNANSSNIKSNSKLKNSGINS